MQNNIQPIPIVLKSYALKHSLIGSFINDTKLYLLKEVFVMAIIGISCCAINWITLWPIALAIAFSIIFFHSIRVFSNCHSYLMSIPKFNNKISQVMFKLVLTKFRFNQAQLPMKVNQIKLRAVVTFSRQNLNKGTKVFNHGNI